MYQDVFLIGGTGSVGSTLVSQIYSRGDVERGSNPTPLRIVGIASSSGYLHDPAGLERDAAVAFSKREEPGTSYSSLLDLLDLTNIAHPGGLVFTDTTAETGVMRDFHLAVVEHSESGIVTANKNPISLYGMDIFERLTVDSGRYGYRCSVMAGAETVNRLRESRVVNNPPSLIMGCFSGTLAYICSQLEAGATVQEATQDAYDKKYTEPHPRDDLSGLDVERKLLVLARSAGFRCDLADIELIPFVDKDLLGEEDPQRFIDSLVALNDSFSENVRAGNESGMVPRYVAKMTRSDGGSPVMEVKLEYVPKDSPLGSLKGTANKVVIVDDNHPMDMPFELCAPGAGVEITAENMRKDIFDLANSS
tara:strand:- start:1051 stop:2142 length:1092 start_codon:yes stop_codon:yes gene_type:complete